MISVKDFSLRHTIESGQPLTFYSSYSSHAGAESLKYVTMLGEIGLTIKGGKLDYSFAGGYTQSSAQAEIISRFALKEDMGRVYKSINTDEFMAGAIKEFYGMRITKNDPWEATICFVLSQFNNLKRIRGIMHSMIGAFGEDTGRYRLFPTAQAIANADVKAIRACGTGFRDKYLKSVAQEFAFSFDKEKLYKMKYEAAKERLMELDGVGDKVADCILLFGYNKLEAFPIDTWVKRAMERIYFNGRKRSIKKIHEFAYSRWPRPYLGYAQQYIFWRYRENKMG
jgi:N-glycosylase/DNA lyase